MYEIKCDDCKVRIGYTGSLAGSAQGGWCNDCRAKHDYNRQVKADKAHFKAQLRRIQGERL